MPDTTKTLFRPLWRHYGTLLVLAAVICAVLPLTVAHQLLQIAEQAARLRQEPDVLQLSEMLLTIRQLPLLAEVDWLSDCLTHLPVASGESP